MTSDTAITGDVVERRPEIEHSISADEHDEHIE